MNPALLRCGRNFLDQRWWALLVIAVVHLAACVLFLWPAADGTNSNFWTGRFFFLATSILWTVMPHLVRNPFRAFLSLPLTADDLWEGYWWVVFGLPSAVSVGVSLLALALVSWVGTPAVPLETLVIWMIGQCGSLALGWCCWCLLPANQEVARQRPISSFCASGLWGVQSSFLLFMIPSSPPWSYCVLGFSAVTIAVAFFGRGWTGQFVLERIGRPDVATITIVRPLPFSARPDGQTGWPVWLRVHVPMISRAFFVGIAMSAWTSWLNQKVIPVAPENRLLLNVYPTLVMFLAAFVAAGAQSSAVSIRAMRLLPLSVRQLAWVSLLHAWVPGVAGVSGVLSLQMAMGDKDINRMIPAILEFLAVSSFFTPISLRYGSGVRSLLASLGLAMLTCPLFIAGIYFRVPSWIPLLTPVMVLGSLLWTTWELRRGRHVYRSRTASFTGMISI